MRLVQFSSDEVLSADKLNEIRSNFDEHFMKLNSSKYYGVVKSGFSINYDSSTRIVSVFSGVGFTPSGKLVTFEGRRTTEFGTAYDHSNYVHLVFLKQGDDAECHLHYISYEFNGGIFDPYSYLKTYEHLYRDYLAIGYIKGGNLYRFNRSINEPPVPVGGLFLYYGEFQDYVTIRGCRKAREHFSHDAYAKFAASPNQNIGGSDSVVLNSSQIPSLTLSGSTSYDGEHEHSVVYAAYTKPVRNDTKWDLGKALDCAKVISGDSDRETDSAGTHSHRIRNLVYENNNVSSISIAPPYMTLVPIERVY